MEGEQARSRETGGTTVHHKQLDALLRSLMGSGNEVSSSPLSVFSVTMLSAHGPQKE